MGPTIISIKRTTGIAGQIAYDVAVAYPGEPETTIALVGSVHGGPVVLIANGRQTFVTDPGRHGTTLNPDWIRRFLA